MFFSKFYSSVFIVILALLATACSGGSVSVSVGIPPIPPIPLAEPTRTFGTITDLGSTTVNGVDFDTANASVVFNGQPAMLTDLEIGHVVLVDGEVDLIGLQGEADFIQFEASVIGPVESADADNKRLVVMGQTVFWDDRTVFAPGIDPSNLSGLPIGSMAQISGLTNAGGDIVATRIETKPDGTQEQLVGKVNALDSGNLLFYINDTLVDYSNSAIVDIAGGEPVNGMYLLVRGSLQNGLLAASELGPTINVTQGEPLERALVQGFITRFESSTDFSIADTSLATDFDTDYVLGTVADLGLDAEVTIDGRFSLDGQAIVAETIRFGHFPIQTTTQFYPFTDFAAISVTSVFDVTIEQGQDYMVEVTIDDSAIGNLVIEQAGDTLHLGLQGTIDNVETTRARVIMPTLDHLISAGVIRTTLSGFNQPFIDIDLGGVSALAATNSTVSNVTANVSGVSSLNLGNVSPIGSASLSISGASRATLNMGVGSSLSGSVTGASALMYYGTAVSLQIVGELTSTVIRLGNTKP